MMQRAAPDFRSVPQTVSRRPRTQFYKRWTSNGSSVSVWYVVTESADSAAKSLRDEASALPIPTRKIDGFGDEAYLLAPSNPNGERSIWIRKGAVILAVYAPGEHGARHFADLFGGVVDRVLSDASNGAP
jgi:hypothetical protein